MTELPEWARSDSQAPTPDLAEFRRLYAEDDNLWWSVACGHHQNLFEAACERLDELERDQEELRDRRNHVCPDEVYNIKERRL